MQVINTIGHFDLATIMVGAQPSALAMSPDGNSLWVANQGDGSVQVIDTIGLTASAPIMVGVQPSALAMSPDGSSLWVANQGEGSLLQIDPSSQAITASATSGKQPSALSQSTDGLYLWVADKSDGQLTQLVLYQTSVDPAMQNGNAPASYKGGKNQYLDISCTAPGSCTAVGQTVSKKGFGAVAATETDGLWTSIAQPPLVKGVEGLPALGRGFDQVSCSSPGNCAAISTFRNKQGGVTAAIGVQVKGLWGEVFPLTYDDRYPSENSTLNSISCKSDGNCTAVGVFNTAGFGISPPDSNLNQYAMTISETDGVWGKVEPAILEGSDQAPPQSVYNEVSCVSPGNCIAFGGDLNLLDNTGRMIFAEQIDGIWQPVKHAAFEAGDPLFTHFGMKQFACTGPGNCTLVGQSFSDTMPKPGGGFYVRSNYAATVTMVNGSLGPITLVHYGDGEHASLDTIEGLGGTWNEDLHGISCSSTGNCTAIGSYSDADGKQKTMTVSEIDGVWQDAQSAPIAQHSPNVPGWLQDISCVSAGNCTAVGWTQTPNGSFFYDNGNREPDLIAVTMTQTNGIWADPIYTGDQASDFTVLFSVSCTEAGNCTSAGYSAVWAQINPQSSAVRTLSTVGSCAGSSSCAPGLGAQMRLPATVSSGKQRPITKSIWRSNYLGQAGKPGPPTAVHASSGANGRSFLTWTSPGNRGGYSSSTGLRYSVTMAEGPLYRSWIKVRSCQLVVLSSCIATGLVNAASYAFRVTAINPLGHSLASLPSAKAVPSSTKPGSPRQLLVEPGEAWASLTWKKPLDSGGLKVSYTLKVANFPYAKWSTVKGCKAISARTCKAAGLHNATDYRFKVFASNSRGSSLASSNSSVFTLSSG